MQPEACIIHQAVEFVKDHHRQKVAFCPIIALNIQIMNSIYLKKEMFHFQRIQIFVFFLNP